MVSASFVVFSVVKAFSGTQLAGVAVEVVLAVVVGGVNALAGPVFDFRNAWRGTIAIVGATQLIRPMPSKEQLAQVLAAATEISRRLGWRTP